MKTCKTINVSYNTSHKNKKNKSSSSPNQDPRRTSSRKSAGQMPHYLARESNEQKGVKQAKKLGVDLNKNLL